MHGCAYKGGGMDFVGVFSGCSRRVFTEHRGGNVDVVAHEDDGLDGQAPVVS